MDIGKINFAEKFAKLPGGDYAVGIIAKMNNYEFKVVKFKGDFIVETPIPKAKRGEIGKLNNPAKRRV